MIFEAFLDKEILV